MVVISFGLLCIYTGLQPFWKPKAALDQAVARLTSKGNRKTKHSAKVAMRRGGESGIRTHGGFTLAGFQDRFLKPLGHLSVLSK